VNIYLVEAEIYAPIPIIDAIGGVVI